MHACMFDCGTVFGSGWFVKTLHGMRTAMEEGLFVGRCATKSHVDKLARCHRPRVPACIAGATLGRGGRRIQRILIQAKSAHGCPPPPPDLIQPAWLLVPSLGATHLHMPACGTCPACPLTRPFRALSPACRLPSPHHPLSSSSTFMTALQGHFLVSRQRILSQPPSFYSRLVRYLLAPKVRWYERAYVRTRVCHRVTLHTPRPWPGLCHSHLQRLLQGARMDNRHAAPGARYCQCRCWLAALSSIS